ncbi:MAG TPA: ABC transporter ATP-binding protein [Euzebyales bacterium]|nr:ABC transporter ATP-binding protein [Euzebyales bacterium]
MQLTSGVRSAERATVRRIAALFSPYRRQVALVVTLIVATGALSIVNPILIRYIFDDALFVAGGPDLRLLTIIVGTMTLLTVAVAVVGVWQTLIANRLGNRVMQDLRDRLFAHLQTMDLGFFTATRTGQIQSRLGNDVGGIQSVVTDTASTILSNVVTVSSAVIAMAVLSWRLTLVSLLVLPLFIYLQIRVGRRRRAVASDTQASLADMTAITEESLSVSGMLLSKVFNRQAAEIARYRAENARQARLQVTQTMTGQSFFALVMSFFQLLPAIIYLVAGFVLAGVLLPGAAGSLTPGILVAFTTLQSRLLFPLMRMLQVAVEVQTSFALFSRIFEYLDLEPQITDRPGARAVDAGEARGHVRFADVWFRYPEPRPLAALSVGVAPPPGVAASGDGERPDPVVDAERWILRDLNFEVRPGQLAALVGPSGAGKTTTSYLIPRLYDVTEGKVTIDGVDVRDVTLSSLADLIGMVTQDTYLFHASVRENLRYADPGASDEQLVAAAKAANIHDTIMRFEDGYDTIVGERGYRMSGGEQQRLSIARVILADPRILILDEATSALDTTSERLVQQALEPLMAQRTTLAIAHRLSTILAADVIFVLVDGRVVEQGTHAELLARGGRYAQLYEEQFGGGEVEARCSDGIILPSGRVMTNAPG